MGSNVWDKVPKKSGFLLDNFPYLSLHIQKICQVSQRSQKKISLQAEPPPKKNNFVIFFAFESFFWLPIENLSILGAVYSSSAFKPSQF